MKRTKRFLLLTLLLVAGLVLVACAPTDEADAPVVDEVEVEDIAEDDIDDETGEVIDEGEDEAMDEEALPSIVEIASADENFSTLVTALETAGLVETLQGEGPFTVFAPNNAAFEALPEGTLDALLADEDALREVLLYHVVEGNVTSAQVVGLDSATAISGGELDIAAEGNTVMVNNAAVVTADIQASNGIIHVIDSVLIPPSMMEAEGPGDIVTVASEAGQFETLLAAAEAAGLVETLQGEGPFTVFAPRDAAFEALPEGTLDALLADPAALEQVLLYHVVPGEVPAADVVDLESATTALGEEVEINVDGDTVMVNDATVVATDIEAGNGVIHVIDSVLIPPSMQEAEGPGDIVTVASEAGQFETLLAAAEAAGLVETLQSEGPFTVFAPRDAAFEALPEGALDELLADPAALEQVLLYHVVPGEVMAADVTELNGALSANDLPLDISADDAGVMVNNANVVATDIEASNGVIHVIDAVLLPPENDIVGVVTSDENFSTLATAVEAAGLVETLQGEGPFTVFAPTNTAFSALPAGALDSLLDDPDALSNVLLYHVAEGALFAGDVAAMDMDSLEAVAGETVEISVDDDGNVFINDAQVTMTNILTTNGIIHVIDAVLLPPGS